MGSSISREQPRLITAMLYFALSLTVLSTCRAGESQPNDANTQAEAEAVAESLERIPGCFANVEDSILRVHVRLYVIELPIDPTTPKTKLITGAVEAMVSETCPP